MCVYVCMDVWIHVNVCRCSLRLEEAIRSSQAGDTGGCEVPDSGAGNRTQVRGKSSERS